MLLLEESYTSFCDVLVLDDDILHRTAERSFHRDRIFGLDADILRDRTEHAADTSLFRGFEHLPDASREALHIILEVAEYLSALLLVLELEEHLLELLLSALEALFSGAV